MTNPTKGFHAPGSYGAMLPGVDLQCNERDGAVYVHGDLYGWCIPLRSGQWTAYAYGQGYHTFLGREQAEVWLIECAEKEAGK